MTFISAEDSEERKDPGRNVAPDAASVRGREAVHLVNVRQTYGGQAGVEIDDLRIRRGCVTAIMGRSGSGKSTLLNLIGGMAKAEKIATNSILIATIRNDLGELREQNVLLEGWSGYSHAVGFVFQHPFMLRYASGADNLAMSMAAAGKTTDFEQIAEFWSTQLLMSRDKISVPAQDLSGGMQQRLAVGRALIRDPQIILADEPTANLDPQVGNEIIERICLWQREGGPDRTVILVTHDIAKARRYADELIVLDPHIVGGRGTQLGPGRLLGVPGSWPKANPKDESVISAWMQGFIDASPEAAAPTGARAAESSQTIAAGERLDPRNRSMKTADTVRPKHAGRAAPWLVWCRLGWASLLSQPVIQRGRLSQFLVSAMLFIPILISAALWLFGSNDVYQVLGMAIVPLAVPITFPAFFPRLAWAAVLRIIMMTILATLAIAALKAHDVIGTMMEVQLSRPDLRPLIALRGGESMTTRVLDYLQSTFEKARVVDQARGLENRSVFGRVSVGEARVLIPENTSADSAPSCPSGNVGNAQIRTAPVLGLDRDEPFLSNLEWSPVDPQIPAKRASIHWTRGVAQTHPASLEEENNSNIVYLLDDYLRNDLKIGDNQDIPRWLCMSDSLGLEYVPYRIAALIKYVALIDKRQHAVIASCDTAARFRAEGIACTERGFKFDHAAIELAPDRRRTVHLDLIKQLSDQRVISAETGFQKIQESLKAASFAAGVSSWFIALTAFLAGSVTFFSIMQFIEENRRPLAVARAFGAKFSSLGILLSVNLLVPFGIALCAGLFFAEVTLPRALGYAFSIFDKESAAEISDGGGIGAMIPFLDVAIFGSLIVALVFLGSLFGWWWRGSGSLARELQEVG